MEVAWHRFVILVEVILVLLFARGMLNTGPHTVSATSSTTPGAFDQGDNKAVVEESSVPLDCDRILTESYGHLTSPDYPTKSTDFLRCRVTIRTTPDVVPVVVFHEFELIGYMRNDECQSTKAYVEIGAIEGRLNRICGSHKPFSVTADTNVITVVMVSTPQAFHWFSATYHVINTVNVRVTFLEQLIGRFDSSTLGQSEERDLIVIHAQPGSRIYVTFEEVDVPGEESIRIEDAATGRILAELYGGHDGFSVSSEGNELLITYRRDSVVVFAYHSLAVEKQRFPECDVYLTDPRGPIQSPGYPIAYPVNLDCVMTIRVDADSRIRLIFSNFSLQPIQSSTDMTDASQCRDYFQITDVTNESHKRICGRLHPFSVTSSSNEVILSLHTDGQHSFQGFSGHYISTERIVSDCVIQEGHDLHFQPISDGLTSTCRKLLSTQPNMMIVIEIDRFHLPAIVAGDDCNRRGIQIQDVVTGRTESFCGTLPWFTWTSDGNEVEISFPPMRASDAERTQFRAFFKALPLPTILYNDYESRQTITSGRGVINIPNTVTWPPDHKNDCFLLFHAPPRRRFRLTVRNLLIADDRSAKTSADDQSKDPDRGEMTVVHANRFLIADVSPLRERMRVFKKAVFTTSQPEFTWASETNEVIITTKQVTSYISDIQFRVEYVTEDHDIEALPNPMQCGYVIVDLPGVLALTSPPNHCEIVFRTSPLERIVLNVTSLSSIAEQQIDNKDCGKTFVELKDSLTGRAERFCFLAPGFSFSWLSEGNELSILVHDAPAKISMNISYRSLPRMVGESYPTFFVEGAGEFSSLLHTRENGRSETCEITLHMGIYERLHIRFRNFFVGAVTSHPNRIQDGYGCGDRYVQIVDLQTGRRNQYCGQLELFSWTSDSNVVQVTFQALSDASHRGFSAEYTTMTRADALRVTQVRATNWNWPLKSRNTTRHITSPNFPDRYPPGTRTEFILHTEPGNRLLIVTDFFDLDSREDCTGDYLEFKDLGTDRDIVTCGYHAPFTWTSDTNEVEVTFNSDLAEEGFGFRAGFQSVSPVGECEKVKLLNSSRDIMQLHTSELHATFPEKGGVGGHNGTCMLIFQATPEYRIRLTATDLSPAHFASGFIQIFDVFSSHRFHYELSDPRPWSHTSDTNALYVWINGYQEAVPSLILSAQRLRRPNPPECQRLVENPDQNSFMEYAGFSDFDRFLGAVAMQSNSGSGFDDSATDINLLPTGSYPLYGYPDIHECHVIVRLKPGIRLTVVITQFEATGFDCGNMETYALQIEDSTTQRQDVFCGLRQPSSWTSDGNEVLIRLKRHRTDQRIKLVASFNSFDQPSSTDIMCSKVLLEPAMVIESMNFPRFYPQDLSCQTLIHAPLDQRIQLIFTTFKLEGIPGSDCKYDYVEISDLTSGRRERACGALAHYTFTSDSNEVLLRFVADDTVSSQGFQAHYTFQGRPDQRGRNSSCNNTHDGDEGHVAAVGVGAENESGAYCQLLFHAPPSQFIVIKFEYFNLRENPGCKSDYVEVFDVALGTAERFCGSQNGLEFTSRGNEFEISYRISESGKTIGFDANYKALVSSADSDCDQIFDSSQDVVTSPAFSSDVTADLPYANNLDCSYTFLADPMQVIELVFMTFDLEDSTDCSYDYVELQTLGIGTPQRYCGAHAQFAWTSAGSTAILRFHSDHILAGRGFEAKYTVIPKEAPRECVFRFDSASGAFSSPGYPEDYPSNQECKYRITVDANTVVKVTFTEFHLEMHRTCDYDYVQIYNEVDGTSSPRFCGAQSPFHFISTSNEVLVEFHSDASVPSRGFSATFDSLPRLQAETPKPATVPLCEDKTLTASQGVFATPNFPFDYDNDEHCRVDIHLDDETARLRITFHFIDIEEHHGCKWDFVQLTDQTSQRQSDRLCGTFSEPFVWDSDSADVTITFRSDSIVTRKGFYATYTSLPGNE